MVIVSGCRSAPADEITPKPAKLRTDAEIISDLTSSPGTATLQNEDLLELKHWKYGARPPATSQNQQFTGESTASFQFLSGEELDKIVEQLIKTGYLTEKPADQSTFAAALRNFQHDNELPVTGQLDLATTEKIKENADL